MAHESAFVRFHRRLEAIQDEAASLLKQISGLSEKFVLKHGVSMGAIEARLAETLRQWQS